MTCDEECIRGIVQEELSKIPTLQPGTSKKTKKKSTWNIFLADCTKRQPEGTPLGDRTRACSVEYKILKEDGSLSDYLSKLATSNNGKSNNKNDDNK